MNLKELIKGARRVLGVLTDILLVGRTKGWWKEGHGPKK